MANFTLSWGSALRCAIDPVATGENIRKCRRAREIRVTELADALGVTRNSVYKWERGEALPSIDNLYSLSWIFDVILDELVVGNRDSLDADSGDQLVPLSGDICCASCRICIWFVTSVPDNERRSFCNMRLNPAVFSQIDENRLWGLFYYGRNTAGVVFGTRYFAVNLQCVSQFSGQPYNGLSP